VRDAAAVGRRSHLSHSKAERIRCTCARTGADTGVGRAGFADTAAPDWRLVAASIIDAAVMAFTFLVVVTCTVGMGLPINALDRSAGGPLFLVTIVLTACYFVFFGGIVGQTAGSTSGLGAPDPPDPARSAGRSP
jgi:hypothetical protein